ncbi:MAG: hypothetical protein KF724_13225 [Phycisphaeraceae bacterium]|nr:hypothetical protein [Phycisphaeraceae bacterium]
MADLNDGEALDLRRIFRVHRIFSAVPVALRPGAILLATFLILLMSVSGRLWDGLRGPAIQAPGLLQPAPSEAALSAQRNRLFRITSEFVPRDRRPEGMSLDSIDPTWLRGALEQERGLLDPTTDGSRIERLGQAIQEVEALAPRGTFAATSIAIGQVVDTLSVAIVQVEPRLAATAVGVLAIDLPKALWERDRGFVIFFGLLSAIILSVGAGALARMTAVAFAERPALPPADAVSFALSRWTSFAFAVLLPPLFVGGLFLLGGIVGFLLRVPVLNVLAGALYGVALIFGFLAALAGILWVIALPLMAPSAACDGADAVESCQRSAAYVLRRPLLALGYFAAGVVAWGLGIFVVRVVQVVTVNLTAASGAWLSKAPALGGAGGMPLFGRASTPPPLLSGSERWTAGFIDLWVQTTGIIVTGVAFAILISVATAVYLCLRHACDDQPFEDLWDPDDPSGVRTIP